MANFEYIVKKKFYKVAGATTMPAIDLPPDHLHKCCSDYVLKVLAYTIDASDELKNDKSGFLYWFNNTVNAVVLTLEKRINGAWVFSSTLNGTEGYGTFFSYGFFVNQSGESFIGYQLLWNSVLSDTGPGLYRVSCAATDFAANITTYTTPSYCLQEYTPGRANGTVRIEYNLNGVMGINSDDTIIKDLGTLNWYNAYRLPGYFGFVEREYTQEEIQYNNGQRDYVISEQEPEYTLKLKPVPFFVHDVMGTDVMQADRTLITDYNNRNVTNYILKDVRKNSGYKPEYLPLQSKLAGVEVKFGQRYNNLKHTRQ